MENELNSLQSEKLRVDKKSVDISSRTETKSEETNKTTSKCFIKLDEIENECDRELPTERTKEQLGSNCRAATSPNMDRFDGFDALKKHYEMNLLTENQNRISVLNETIRQTSYRGDINRRQISYEEYESVDAVLARWKDLDMKMRDCINKDALKQKTIMELTCQNEKLKQTIYTINNFVQNVTPSLQQFADVHSHRDGPTASEAAPNKTSNIHGIKRRDRNKRKAESRSRVEVVKKKSCDSEHFNLLPSRLYTVQDSENQNDVKDLLDHNEEESHKVPSAGSISQISVKMPLVVSDNSLNEGNENVL